MSTESQGFDAYEAVLTDLKAKRDQLDQAIAAIEALRGGNPANMTILTPSQNAAHGPGAFLGMTIVDAAKSLLASRRRPLKNPDIAAAFKEGGLILQSKEPANTIGSVLTRRFAEVGDVVRVGRGTWGLKEWYPNRDFKKKTPTNLKDLGPDDSLDSKGESGTNETSET
jgi:HB1/ASXL restriction endonuclease-like protein with HTH domain